MEVFFGGGNLIRIYASDDLVGRCYAADLFFVLFFFRIFALSFFVFAISTSKVLGLMATL